MDKRMTAADVVGQLQDGMTLGIGGWGPRRKPMAWCARSSDPTSRTSPWSPTAAPTSACSVPPAR